MKRFLLFLVAICFPIVCVAGELPAGMGKYVVVLWDPGTPIPGTKPVRHARRVPEPDLAAIGGRLEYKEKNHRVAVLPFAAVAQLRRHEAVMYVQRLWMGETEEEWAEQNAAADGASAGRQIRSDAVGDSDLSWGPKEYAYDGSGNITAIDEDAYAYDTAGRLISATTHPTVGGAARTETFTYDAFGNRTGDSVDGASHPVGVDPANNRLVGATYDVVGNMTEGVMSGVWGARTYRYDALSRMTAVGQGSFQRRMLYDASDERIATVVDNSLTRWTFRDLQGRLLREYHSDSGGTWTWEADYVYGAGHLVAGETQPNTYTDEAGTWVYGGERHYHLDHLGSVRLVTDWAGRSLTEHDYAPFGVTTTKTYQEPSVPSGHVDAMRYAGHWRDFLGWGNVDNTEYLDYMHARYYDPNLGRFLSVDPVLEVKRAMRSPQLWNRYSYALNNPLIYTDPTGKTVYVVMHTVGNAEGDDEFRRAAMTRAAAIRAQKGFDPKKDTVLVRGVASKESFAKVIKEANGLQSTFGKVGQVNMFSHGGPAHGPMFQQGTANQSQDPGFLASVRVNWDRSASACFFACNSGINFTQMYATAQGVPAYGYEASASFSSTPNEWSLIRSTGPVYLIQTSGWSNGGPWGALGKWLGFNDGAVPMDRDDP